MIPFILLGLGLFSILTEFFVPGAIMGIIGCLLILAAIILFVIQTNSVVAIIFFIIGTLIAVALMIRFALWRIVSNKSGFSIYSRDDQEGYRASKFDPNVIGKTGIVLSDLKPGGYILIEGNQHQAISVSGYLPKGTEVIVLSGQEESLIVKSLTKETRP